MNWPFRKSVRLGVCIAILFALTSVVDADDQGAEADGPALRFFENKVRPLLNQHCYSCHSRGAKTLKGGLRLDDREGLLAGGDSGPVVVPGNVDESRLIQAVRHSDPHLRMPPSKRLSDPDLAILETWVKNGAVFSQSVAGSVPTQKSHWSLIAPKMQAIPAIELGNWAQNPIDHFVLARLEAQQRTPASSCDQYSLIRRVTYDLTGLPATEGELSEFVNDDSPSAYATVVDRLLASPRFGERWGRHWLDLVRYADDFEEAWRYRDWVIRAANEDLGYDQFVIHQIAGDLLPAPSGQSINSDGIVATTMLSIGPWGGIDRKKRLADIVDDQIDIIGRSFLGLTLACARCHDHKFDPITAEDYYALAGFFYSSHIISDAGYLSHGTKRLRIPLAPIEEVQRHDQRQAEIRALEAALRTAVDDRYTDFARSLIPQTSAYLKAAYEFEFWSSDQPKPALKDFASARSLHPFGIERWIEYLKQPPVTAFRLFDQGVANYDDEKGVHIWRSHTERPWWGVNTNAYDVPIETFNLPPRTVSVYPSVDGGAVVWKSPVDGNIRLSGRLIDADPLDGVGIAWLIDLVSEGVRQELSSGTMPATGSMDLADGRHAIEQLTAIPVHIGDSIEFQAWLSQGDAHYDVTNVEIEITDVKSGLTWNLNRDVMDNLLRCNPHPDSQGHADTWSFLDMDGSHRKQRMPTVDELMKARSSLSLANRSIVPDRQSFADAADEFQSRIDASGQDSPLIRDLTGIRSPFWVRQRDDAKYLSAEAQALLAKRKSEIDVCKAETKPLAYANGVQDGGLRFSSFPQIQDIRMHVRGNPEQLGEPIARRFPNALNNSEKPEKFTGSGRRELARWLASRDNPLLARVIVNRVWRSLIGDGIVRTPSNFGALGESPTHPELLDWLSLRFMDSGWSVKDLTRLIVTSATYQQSTQSASDPHQVDPDNRDIARMNRRRLEAEEVADSLLAVSERLDERMGGPPDDRSRPRRMVYLKTLRSDKSSFGVLFDAADPSMHVEKRTSSTVAPQALEMMNGSLLLDVTSALVRSLNLSESRETTAGIHALYRKVFGRNATSDEIAIGVDFLSKFSVGSNDSSTGAAIKTWEAYAQVLLLSNEFLFVD